MVPRVWRGTLGRLNRVRRGGWVDLLLIVGVAGLMFGLMDLFGQATAAHRPTVEIDLSWRALPRYTFYSLTRGLAAYVLSLAFTLVYGYWAAKDHAAERVLIPLLDVLQSIPVLSFMPGILLMMVALFPRSNVGLELAVIISIFTGQVWNMVFSLYHSLRSIPADKLEVASIFRFTAWQKAKWIELPSAVIGLIWNSMMSMAGGWFFLTIIESFKLARQGLSAARPRVVSERDVEAGPLCVNGRGHGRYDPDDRRFGLAALAAGRRVGPEIPGGRRCGRRWRSGPGCWKPYGGRG